MTFGAECAKAQTGRIIDFVIKLNPPPPMRTVVTTSMDCAKVDRIVGASVASFDQVVSRVGAGLAAQVADALVAGDDKCCQLSPRLRSVGTVYCVAPHALGWSPTVRAMEWRFPGHVPSSPLPSVWIRYAGAVASAAFGLLG